MSPTPYEILRVPRDCTDDAIRHAYRRLAKELHPDHNPGNPAAHRQFLEICDAYQAIGTAQKRKLWDLMNPEGGKVQPPPSPPPPPRHQTYQPSHQPSPAHRTQDSIVSLKARWAGAAQKAQRHDSSLPLLLETILQRTGVRFGLICLAVVGGFALLLPERPEPERPPPSLSAPAIQMLAQQARRLNATVTAVDAGASRLTYQYRDASNGTASGQCAPCPYAPLAGLKEGDSLIILHLTGTTFTAPLFAFENLTRIDPALVNQVNALAEHASSATERPAP